MVGEGYILYNNYILRNSYKYKHNYKIIILILKIKNIKKKGGGLFRKVFENFEKKQNEPNESNERRKKKETGQNEGKNLRFL